MMKGIDSERCFECGRFMVSLDDGDQGHPFDARCPQCVEVVHAD